MFTEHVPTLSAQVGLGLIGQTVHWGGFEWHGNFVALDLIAATTNALNGALLARRSDHSRTSRSSASC